MPPRSTGSGPSRTAPACRVEARVPGAPAALPTGFLARQPGHRRRRRHRRTGREASGHIPTPAGGGAPSGRRRQRSRRAPACASSSAANSRGGTACQRRGCSFARISGLCGSKRVQLAATSAKMPSARSRASGALGSRVRPRRASRRWPWSGRCAAARPERRRRPAARRVQSISGGAGRAVGRRWGGCRGGLHTRRSSDGDAAARGLPTDVPPPVDELALSPGIGARARARVRELRRLSIFCSRMTLACSAVACRCRREATCRARRAPAPA